MLVPFMQKKEKISSIDDAIRALKKLRKEMTLTKKLPIKKMGEIGRK
jgi:hypothetical protein